ncbi:sugar-binding domain-containing protein [Lactobacillus sp. ESL0703]|uniref:sugar-binding transcriptional regulator n=1 Tax=Lactobacillus sp. ESL0703 TaxID=2983218 RepID=UPI0023F9FE60|nr:sugar-binding domain-containing protein [Lactobacillus sp. ESL0703]MDF7669427.1 sugar-binding domain-containing protein [Lactobacillus sp. ESL0703]
MYSEFPVLEALVPDILKVFRQRYLVLEQISLNAPIGRRSVAQALGLSERNVRTETEYLRDLGLIEIKSFGMFMTEKGKKTLQDVAPLIDRHYNARQTEVELAQKLGIDRTIIVPGDSDLQERVYERMGEELSSALNLFLPLGKSIITVLGGVALAKSAKYLSKNLSYNRQLEFVPGRGALGENVAIQSNTIVQEMAAKTGGKYKTLYLPEQISTQTYKSLIRESTFADVLEDIAKSDVVIHGIGLAHDMARRRGYDSIRLSELREKKVVTECFGCFFDDRGKIVDRVQQVGLQFENLNKIPHIFAFACGSRKAQAIKAYMPNAPHQTWLITDEGASNKILKGI